MANGALRIAGRGRVMVHAKWMQSLIRKRKQSRRGPTFVSRSRIRIPSPCEKGGLSLRLRQIRESHSPIFRSNAKPGETARNFGAGNSLAGAKNGFLDSNTETARRKKRTAVLRARERERDDERDELSSGREEGCYGKRLIKCKLERKMIVVIYRHKSAIRQVFFGLNEQRRTKGEKIATTTAKSSVCDPWTWGQRSNGAFSLPLPRRAQYLEQTMRHRTALPWYLIKQQSCRYRRQEQIRHIMWEISRVIRNLSLV